MKKTVSKWFITTMERMSNFRQNALKTILLLILSGSAVGFADAQEPAFSWVKQVGGQGANRSMGIALDPTGNVYITGNFNDTVSFGNGIMLTPTVSTHSIGNAAADIFVAKYTSSGNCIWAKKIGGEEEDLSFAIAVDDSGNVYTAGQFSSAKADFNPGTGLSDTFFLSTDGTYDIFVSKLDSSGNFVWAKQFPTNYAAHVRSMAVNNKGDVYLTGAFSGEVDFNKSGGGFKLTSFAGIGDDDIFVCKLDKDGHFLWARQMGGMSADRGNAIAVDKSGNAYITGYFGGIANFNMVGTPVMLTALGGSNLFIAKIDSDGQTLWAKGLLGEGYSYGETIAVDNKGSVYSSGSFSNRVDFDPGADSFYLEAFNAYSQDIYISKLDTSGSFVWARQIESSQGSGVGHGITTDTSGAIYLTGIFYGKADFNPDPRDTAYLVEQGRGDIFILRLDATGHYSWAKQLSGTENEQGNAIAVNSSNDVYTTGFFDGEADFDPGPNRVTLTALGTSGGFGIGGPTPDAFLHKMNCVPTKDTLNANACKQYIFFGENLTQSGTYQHTIANAAGCDSIITLQLVILHPEAIITIKNFELSTSKPFQKYQWLLNGQLIPGATQRTLPVTQNGDYRVAVEDTSGCTDTSDIYTVNNYDGNSIEHVNALAQAIKVYPNPATERIIIQSPVKVEAVLTDVTGRRVKQVADARQIPLKDLTAGVYLLRIYHQAGTLIKVEKIIKQAE